MQAIPPAVGPSHQWMDESVVDGTNFTISRFCRLTVIPNTLADCLGVSESSGSVVEPDDVEGQSLPIGGETATTRSVPAACGVPEADENSKFRPTLRPPEFFRSPLQFSSFTCPVQTLDCDEGGVSFAYSPTLRIRFSRAALCKPPRQLALYPSPTSPHG